MSIAPATTPASANPPAEVRKWFDTRPTYRAKMPALGTIAAGLVVLNRLLTEDFSLAEKDHVAVSRGQIKGLNKGAAARILAEHGEAREFPEEGGRTNRGNIVAVAELLEALREAGLEQMPEPQRRLAVQESIRFLVEKVGEWHNRQRLKPKFDPAKTTTVFLESILKEARERRTEGDVAQHLVGAVLKLRHPNANIPNQRVAAADQQTKRAADFTIGDAMFHVTTSPSALLIDKCARNVEASGRPVILTRDRDRVASARALAEDKGIVEKLTIRTVSAFVADIVDELGAYSQSSIRATLRALVELYNKNVDEVEIDKSMLIELPANL